MLLFFFTLIQLSAGSNKAICRSIKEIFYCNIRTYIKVLEKTKENIKTFYQQYNNEQEFTIKNFIAISKKDYVELH